MAHAGQRLDHVVMLGVPAGMAAEDPFSQPSTDPGYGIDPEVRMLVNLVRVRVKPQQRQRFLQAIAYDALGSERDEPGCLRFNVLQDKTDENVYYFYEVYRDEAALEAHRAAPHYAVWRDAAAEVLDGQPERMLCETVFPAEPGYWRKR